MSSLSSSGVASASTNTNNDALVQAIVINYSRLEVLHPIVAEMSKDANFKRMFWAALSHELQVITRRSQVLSDCQITAAQKAFKILMEDEDYVAAVEIYVDEILGIGAALDDDKAQTLATMLQTRDYIVNKFYADVLTPSPDVLTQYRGRCDDGVYVFSGSDEESPSRSAAFDKSFSAADNIGTKSLMPGQDDTKMKRLFDMYRNSKADFHATLPKSLDRTKAAKFLRDTIENCLTHIAHQQHSDDVKPMTKVSRDGITMGELKSTLKKATELAEKGSGGKKRRFDEDSVPQVSDQVKVHETPRIIHHGYRTPRGRRASPPNLSRAHGDCYRPAYR